jgi:hypothetical protein
VRMVPDEKAPHGEATRRGMVQTLRR